ncbi:MAG TPA: hypothetical protein VNO31_39455 [Umezawaea sp.]|nr:hypothetical protein [Umezawaea sp.]
MAKGHERETARRILGEAMRELEGPIRREVLRQKFRRWRGRSFFQLRRVSADPIHVLLDGVAVTPLWETSASGPNDLDLVHPLSVTRRYSLGHEWFLHHDYDDVRIPVVLLVAEDGDPWFAIPRGKTFPATPAGWELLVRELELYARPRGGRWQGGG